MAVCNADSSRDPDQSRENSRQFAHTQRSAVKREARQMQGKRQDGCQFDGINSGASFSESAYQQGKKRGKSWGEVSGGACGEGNEGICELSGLCQITSQTETLWVMRNGISRIVAHPVARQTRQQQCEANPCKSLIAMSSDKVDEATQCSLKGIFQWNLPRQHFEREDSLPGTG